MRQAVSLLVIARDSLMNWRATAVTVPVMHREIRFLVVLTLVAAACALAVAIGLAVSEPGSVITAVWPASGVALALILRLGVRVWPAMAVGAFAAHMFSGLPGWVSFGLAVAVTLEAVAGWWLLSRRFPTDLGLEHLWDVVRLSLLSKAAALVGVGLTIALLAASDLLEGDEVLGSSLVMWLAHALGVLVVTPPLLAWTQRSKIPQGVPREDVVIFALTLAVALLVFTTSLGIDAIFPKWSYIVFPFALWAATRSRVRGAATACLLIAIVAVVGTMNGRGPFTSGSMLVSLLSLQAFLAVLGLSSLVLAASVCEREQARAEAEIARRREEAASHSKSMFLASASHDLRQPLNALSLFNGVLRARSKDRASREVLDRMDSSLTTLVEMFDGLLDVSKLEMGVTPAEHTVFPIENLLERVRSAFAATAAGKGLRFSVVVSTVLVRSDPILLERILRNLVANAVAHTVTGGVVVGCRLRGDHVRLDVVDTGPGIAPEHADRIFDDLYQVGNPERNRARGHGLGLAIVRRAAALLGHRLDLSSQPGKGSCFSVYVPLIRAHRRPDVPVRRHAPRQRVPDCALLVVEDDPEVSDAMVLTLEEFGGRVVKAACGREALDHLAKGWSPEMVIADFRLPGDMDGIDTVKAIRERIGPVPACIISGDVSDEVRRRANREVGRFIAKPISPEALKAIVIEGCGSVLRPLSG